MLSMLMALRDEETGAGLTDQEIRDQVNTFIGAGHETTAVALTWTWYLLSQHREIEEQVRDEVCGLLDGRVPTVADLPRLALTRRVIEEALRLFPPVYAVAKDAAADDVIGGYRIPARSIVVLSQYVTHRHPEFWDEPERFDPDRFLPERVAARPRFAYFPFLGGPHHCIGSDFAMMEAMLIVAMTVQRYRLWLIPGAVITAESKLTMRPRGGLPMMLERVI
jgi:cytochrome P450